MKIELDPQIARTPEQGIAAKGWIIGSAQRVDGQLVLSFTQHPIFYLSEDRVKQDLEKLAREMPNVKFISFKVDTTAESMHLVWS
jgi:hypothetical protein